MIKSGSGLHIDCALVVGTIALDTMKLVSLLTPTHRYLFDI